MIKQYKDLHVEERVDDWETLKIRQTAERVEQKVPNNWLLFAWQLIVLLILQLHTTGQPQTEWEVIFPVQACVQVRCLSSSTKSSFKVLIIILKHDYSPNSGVWKMQRSLLSLIWRFTTAETTFWWFKYSYSFTCNIFLNLLLKSSIDSPHWTGTIWIRWSEAGLQFTLWLKVLRSKLLHCNFNTVSEDFSL